MKPRPRPTRGALAGLAAAVALAAAAQAQTTAPSPQGPPGSLAQAGAAAPVQQAPDTLLGDLYGLRPALKPYGLILQAGYKGELAANPAGGRHLAATESGQGALSVAFDPEALFGVEGGTAQLTLTYRHGARLGDVAGLDVLQQVQEIYGRGQTFRLTELWYQQVLAHGELVLKAGRFPAGDFNTFDCDLMNLTFCGAPAGNLTGYYWFNYPVARWGGWAKARRGALYAKVGVAEDNRNNLDSGIFVYKPGARGVITDAEAGWTPGFGGGRLPGRYQAGWWRTSASDPDVLVDAAGRPFAVTGLAARQDGGQTGEYVQLQQQLTGEAKEDPVSGVISRTRGVLVFANFTRNDAATSTTLDQETLGFYWTAPVSRRPKDQLALALGRTHYNGRAAEALVLAQPGGERRDDEYVAELNYAYRLLRGVILRPNFQYILDPGGLRNADDVVIAGLRFDINL